MCNDNLKDMDYKTISLIEQQLNEETLLAKKYLNYSNLCFDSELKNICFNASQQHKKNCKAIVLYLKKLEVL